MAPSKTELGILSAPSYEDIKLDDQPERNMLWKSTRTLRYNDKRPAVARSTNWFSSSASEPLGQKRRPTAWLDGLRGFAAFLVYIHHHELWVHDSTGQNSILENGFGYEGQYYFAAFPFIRNFFTGGHYAVTTFYVISGYTLSLKGWRLIHMGDVAGLGDHLASSFFRRWFRLYLPIILFMFVFVTTWHVFPYWTSTPEQQATWRGEIWELYVELKNFSFVYKEGGVPWLKQHFHLWSIPVEFRGSMVIFASLLAFSRASRAAQLWCQGGLICYFLYVADGWYCAMFVSGMMLCQFDILAEDGELPVFVRRLAPYKNFIYYHALLLSFYLGGVPSANNEVEHLAKMRGWYYLSWLKPQAVFDYKWFYLFWAATLLVACISRMRWLKRFFETPFCQHLGRISYALYMVHGPILWTLGERVYAMFGWYNQDHAEHLLGWIDKIPIPRWGPLCLETNFLAPQLFLLPITLLVAEVVTRTMDSPSVRFASWLYGKCRGGAELQPKYAKA